MHIDPRKCVACGNCLAVCPVSAIYIDPVIRRATVNLDECVEYYACHNRMSKEDLNPTLVRTIRGFLKLLRIRFDPEPDVCPTSAFAPEDLTWPRSIRQAFSDPCVPHESTGIYGRGTEEVKTNDVTNRVGPGEVGFTVVEVKTPEAMLPIVLRRVEEVSAGLDTVVSMGVAVRCDGDGENRVEKALAGEGYTVFRGKTNLGLGRLTNLEAQAQTAGAAALAKG